MQEPIDPFCVEAMGRYLSGFHIIDTNPQTSLKKLLEDAYVSGFKTGAFWGSVRATRIESSDKKTL